MHIDRTRERSGPIYSQQAGRIVSYVVERNSAAIRLGRFRIRLPEGRQVFVIDDAGVHRIKRNRLTLPALVLLAFALALLAGSRSPRRGRLFAARKTR
jgi:hypothetical protein